MNVERCRALRDQIARCAELRDATSKVAVLEPVRFDVEDWQGEFGVLVPQYRLFLAEGLIPDNEAAPKRLLEALAAVRKKLRESPFKVNSGKDYSTLKKQATELIRQLGARITEAWGDWLARETPSVDEAELVRLEAILEMRVQTAEVRRQDQKVKEMRRSPPRDAAGLAQARAVVEALRVALQKLPKPASPEVARFLDAATSREGAPLSLLNDAVLAWLKDEGQYDRFRIRR